MTDLTPTMIGDATLKTEAEETIMVPQEIVTTAIIKEDIRVISLIS